MANQEQQLIAKDLLHLQRNFKTRKPQTFRECQFSLQTTSSHMYGPKSDRRLKIERQSSRNKVQTHQCCGQAEGLLESHFSSIIGSHENALNHVTIFPYYSNYQKLSQLEFAKLTEHCKRVPKRIAFVGSGPLPLTSIFLATNHFKTTSFHNYDIDHSANTKANRLVSSHSDLSKQMFFHTKNIMDVPSSELKEYEVVFLAALVGVDKADKVKVINHLAKNMAPGAFLLLRSAHGARAFLYPVVDPNSDLEGFKVLSVFHPTVKSSILSLLHVSFDARCPLLESLIMEAATLTQSIRK